MQGLRQAHALQQAERERAVKDVAGCGSIPRFHWQRRQMSLVLAVVEDRRLCAQRDDDDVAVQFAQPSKALLPPGPRHRLRPSLARRNALGANQVANLAGEHGSPFAERTRVEHRDRGRESRQGCQRSLQLMAVKEQQPWVEAVQAFDGSIADRRPEACG